MLLHNSAAKRGSGSVSCFEGRITFVYMYTRAYHLGSASYLVGLRAPEAINQSGSGGHRI